MTRLLRRTGLVQQPALRKLRKKRAILRIRRFGHEAEKARGWRSDALGGKSGFAVWPVRPSLFGFFPMEPLRLQKFLADAGICSRRAAEVLIARGEVWVNGTAATLGQKISPGVDRVTV